MQLHVLSVVNCCLFCFLSDASLVMLTLDDYSVHDVTGTLKKYLRELPEPVCPDGMYKEFIAVSRKLPDCVVSSKDR